MPPIHPHPHDAHRPHTARWLYSSEGELTLAQASELLRRFADELAETSAIELGDLKVALPPTPWAIVRHERLPRGELVLKFELKWLDGPPAAPDAQPISALLP